MTKSECEKKGGKLDEKGHCEYPRISLAELEKDLYCSDAVVELGGVLVEEGTITNINELQYFYEKPWKWAPEWKKIKEEREREERGPIPYPKELSEVAEGMLKTMGWKDYAESVFHSFDIGEDIGEGRHDRIKKVLDVYPKADYMDVSRFFEWRSAKEWDDRR